VPPPDDRPARTSPGTDAPLDAGAFGAWLDAMAGALAGEHGSDVPCGDCTGCCTSSQFVHIGPDEVGTLARIPKALRFPAPGLPAGHVLLGYDERGHCPMLADGACTIYEHRPRTCRTYDCRVFPAAGVEPDEQGKAAIAARVRRWRFAHPGPGDEARHEAVRTAAAYLRRRAGDLPDAVRPRTPTQLAVLAVEAHRAFLPGAGDAEGASGEPGPAAVLVQVTRRRP
jgi:uncharacterized protein